MKTAVILIFSMAFLSANVAVAEDFDFCNMRDAEEIEDAFAKGAVISKEDDPIRCFSSNNSEFGLKAVKILVKHGSNVNLTDDGNRSVLYWALSSGLNEHTLEMVKFLLNKGANPAIIPKDYNTPLHLAVDGWPLEIIKLMLQKGAKADKPSTDGTYPIHFARSKEVLKLLLDKGAKINTKNRTNQTILHYLTAHTFDGVSDDYKEGILSALKYAVEKGADINAQADYVQPGPVFSEKEHYHRATPLHTAVFHNNPELVKLLLELGAKKDIKDSRKMTPADYAKNVPELNALFN